MTTFSLTATFIGLIWFFIIINAFKRIKERKENPEKYDSLPKADNTDTKNELFKYSSDIRSENSIYSYTKMD